jgi:hypothetical protein
MLLQLATRLGAAGAAAGAAATRVALLGIARSGKIGARAHHRLVVPTNLHLTRAQKRCESAGGLRCMHVIPLGRIIWSVRCPAEAFEPTNPQQSVSYPLTDAPRVRVPARL